MNKEEKEQWLYEVYQYTSNFDFNRLDKYEEANDDICIDDLILDYTMLYEFHKEEIEKQEQEIERLNNIIKTKDEGIKALTDDLCEESTKIEKAIDYINKRKQEREKVSKYAYDIRNDDFIKYCNIELNILKGGSKE